jgi:hypothetical protein
LDNRDKLDSSLVSIKLCSPCGHAGVAESLDVAKLSYRVIMPHPHAFNLVIGPCKIDSGLSKPFDVRLKLSVPVAPPLGAIVPTDTITRTITSNNLQPETVSVFILPIDIKVDD